MAEFNNNHQKPVKKQSIVIPLAIIFIGILLLLRNLGFLHWNVWSIFARFWPLILITLGLEFIIGKRSTPIIIIIIIILSAIIISSGLVPTRLVRPLRNTVNTTTIEKPLSGIESADIEISMDSGNLSLNSIADSQNLISGTIETVTGERLTEDFHVTAGEAYLSLSNKDKNTTMNFNFFNSSKEPTKSWDLLLCENIPIRLNVHTGVGRTFINLRHVKATGINIQIGVGKTDLILPSTCSTKVKLSGGVGETVVEIPQGVAARIRIKTGIGPIQVNGNYIYINNEYISPDFDTAKNIIDLEIKGGIGSITIRDTHSHSPNKGFPLAADL
jgi:hypothetical protein